MIKIIFGLVLLLIPFLLVYRFKNKKIGFVYILSFLLGFHLIVAVLTQIFGVFNYWVIFGINLLVALVILIKINFKQFGESLKKIKINWIFIFMIVILFIQLYSVHYNYTGKVSTSFQAYTEVENMKYPYPYYSDEWSAVSLIKYSIGSGKLPLVNPLWHNVPFPNFELAFHSFTSEMILLLGLNPLIHYTVLTIFSGFLICLLIYLILRVNVNKFASAIACLSVLYIVNGANLPGIWNFMPLTLGLISLLSGFFFMSINSRKMIFFMAFLTLIFYPPLFVLYSISLILYFIFADIPKKEKIKAIFLFLIICALVALVLFIFAFFIVGSLDNSLRYVRGNLFYETFTKNAMPDFSIWKIIPIPILLLSVFGIFKVIRIKRKIWLIAPIFVGLIYWWIYSFVLWRFIIEYSRIIVSTSILITLLSGLGLHLLVKDLKNIDKTGFLKKYKILEFIQIAVLIMFFILAFSYTQRNNWQELKLYSIKTNEVFYPAAPASIQLHEDDLKLFENIKQKNFLTIPWKGTVIGAATNNYPLDTKPATITNNLVSLNKFMEKNCEKKLATTKNKKIIFVYAPEFNCEGFKLIGKSREGLYLYEVI